MVEYIEKEAAQKIICGWCGVCKSPTVCDLMHCDDICPQFAQIPAADVRPVVRGHNTGNARIFECSECGYGFDDIYLTNEHDYPIDPNFCPNCGADMRKEPPEEET